LQSVVNGVITIGTVPILLETPSTPTAPVITSDTVNGNNSVTLAGTAQANNTVTVYDGQTALGTTIASASGAWSYTTGPLANGSQVLAATATNIAGLTSAPSAAVDPIISQVPTVTSVATSGSGISNGNGDLDAGHVVTLTLTMSEAVLVAGGTPTLALNDGGTATYTGGSGTTALTFSYTVAAGQNTSDLTVTAVNLNSATIEDSAGNAVNLGGTFTPAGTLQIDTTAPAAPIIDSDKVSGSRVILSGTAEAGTMTKVYQGSTLLGTTSTSTKGTWSFTTPSLSKGAHTFTATATDAAGNVSPLSSPFDPVIGGGHAVTAGSQFPVFGGSGLSEFGSGQGIEPPGITFANGAVPSSAECSRCALLGNHMASSLVAHDVGCGGMTVPLEAALVSQSWLACPHHA
jgi:hypothetical protein